MRQDILEYIAGLNLGGYILTDELPWTDNGTPLYLKNPKKVYVGNVEYATNPVLSTLNGLSFNNSERIVRIYFASDAKIPPSNYDTVVDLLRTSKDIDTVPEVWRRASDVNTSFENDMLVTELEIRFTHLTT